MKDFFTKEKIKAVVIIVPLLYAITYVYILFSAPFSAAQKFVESDPEIAKITGTIKWVLPAFLGRASSHVNSQGGNAYYTMNVIGERDGGEVLLRLILQDNEWKVTTASFISNDNKVIVLKNE